MPRRLSLFLRWYSSLSPFVTLGDPVRLSVGSLYSSGWNLQSSKKSYVRVEDYKKKACSYLRRGGGLDERGLVVKKRDDEPLCINFLRAPSLPSPPHALKGDVIPTLLSLFSSLFHVLSRAAGSPTFFCHYSMDMGTGTGTSDNRMERGTSSQRKPASPTLR